MKYKFVYDTEVICNNSNLTPEERNVVIATVVGKHNALFYGCNPERLVKAVKKLSELFIEVEHGCSVDKLIGCGVYSSGYIQQAEKGVLFVDGLDSYNADFQSNLRGCSINYENRVLQLIATTAIAPYYGVRRELLDNFDIVYQCKNEERRIRPYSDLIDKMNSINKFRSTLLSGRHVTATFAEIDTYWNLSSFQQYYEQLRERKGNVIAMKLAKVARSVSDITKDQMTGYGDLKIAEDWYNEGVEHV